MLRIIDGAGVVRAVSNLRVVDGTVRQVRQVYAAVEVPTGEVDPPTRLEIRLVADYVTPTTTPPTPSLSPPPILQGVGTWRAAWEAGPPEAQSWWVDVEWYQDGLYVGQGYGVPQGQRAATWEEDVDAAMHVRMRYRSEAGAGPWTSPIYPA